MRGSACDYLHWNHSGNPFGSKLSGMGEAQSTLKSRGRDMACYYSELKGPYSHDQQSRNELNDAPSNPHRKWKQPTIVSMMPI